MSWIDAQEKYTLTSDRVRVNHTNAKNVIQYVINPSYYFNQEVITNNTLTFRTLTLTEEELNFHIGEDGGSSKKRIQIIYAVNEFKDHDYFRTHARLIPFEYLKKGEIKKLCCNCLRQMREIENDFIGRRCCKSCWMNSLREVGINLNLCAWKQ
jgi:hypothetical protein